MKNSELNKVISSGNLDLLISKYTPEDVCACMTYKEAMIFANNLFYNNLHNDDIQDFAINLVFEIKRQYNDSWELDWKNDIFLGHLCLLTWRYEEAYNCYKNAYDKLKNPPDSLLLLLAGCNSAPGVPPINDQEAEKYLELAIKQKVTYEAATMMRELYRQKPDKELEKHWNDICEDLKKKNIHTDEIIPEILR